MLTCARESLSLYRFYYILALLKSPECTADFCVILFSFVFSLFRFIAHALCVSMVDDITMLFLGAVFARFRCCSIPFHYFHFVWFDFICCNNRITTISFPFFHNIFWVCECVFYTSSFFFALVCCVRATALRSLCAFFVCSCTLLFLSHLFNSLFIHNMWIYM